MDDDEDSGAGAGGGGNNPWDILSRVSTNATPDGDSSAAMPDTAPAAAASSRGSGPAAPAAAAAAESQQAEALAFEALRQLCLAGAYATDSAPPGASAAASSSGAPPPRLAPRGLVNTGNSCFVNATLQALMSCGPFTTLMLQLPTIAPFLDPQRTPTLHGLALLAAELGGGGGSSSQQPGEKQRSASGGPPPSPPGSVVEDDGWAEVPVSRSKRSSRGRAPASPQAGGAGSPIGGIGGGTPISLLQMGGKPLIPSMLNSVIAAFNPQFASAASSAPAPGAKLSMAQMLALKSAGAVQEQQDAQEFFNFLVDHAHEEVLLLRNMHGLVEAAAAAAGNSNGGAEPVKEESSEEWSQVGKKNKATVTRQVGGGHSEQQGRSQLSAIFGGSLKSTIRAQAPNAKPSATLQSFWMLHLDIQPDTVATLEDALRHHAMPESIEYKPEGWAENVPAKKDLRLYRLPEVLVLHLKRFHYTLTGGSLKLHKPVVFEANLRLKGGIVAEDSPDRNNAEYRLVATVSHHGRNMTGGHYTADVLQGEGRWLRFNDAVVDMVSEKTVLLEKPYLLFYQRVHASA